MEGVGEPVFIGNDIGEDFPLPESNAGIAEDIDAGELPAPFVGDPMPSDELMGE
jgi:hypothetical protein